MTEASKKSGRGGRRVGAGRPKGYIKRFSFRVPGNIHCPTFLFRTGVWL